MIDGVRQLPPAHYLEFDLAQRRLLGLRQYWRPSVQELGAADRTEWIERIKDAFFDNVRLHLRSDVTVGAALSGGIDSTAIASTLPLLGGDKVETFSYIDPDASISEAHWVDEATRWTQLKNNRVTGTPSKLRDDVDDLIRCQGEPFLGTSVHAQYMMFRLAREHGCKVVLEGQGADEMMAGYVGFRPIFVASQLRRGRLASAFSHLRDLWRTPRFAAPLFAQHLVASFVPQALQGVARQASGRADAPQWMDRGWALAARAAARDRHVVQVEWERPKSLLQQKMLERLFWSGLPALLRHGDRNAMKFSIENRVPFLTPSFVNLMLSVPDESYYGADGLSKAPFRQAMAAVMPPATLARRDKIGFGTSELNTFTVLNDWIEESFAGASAVRCLDIEGLRREWAHVRQGRGRFDFRIWRCINFIRWSQMFGIAT
jgi:asparagine synthase (glutamine-hydrolysing)